jgi:hypothetical protein
MDQATYYFLRVIAAWIQAAGVLIAVVTFAYSILYNRRRRALERYEDITTKWMDFLNSCLNNPDLDIGPLSVTEKDMDNAEKERTRRVNAAFIQVLILFERMFILESVVRSPAKLQSDAYEGILKSYLKREGFRAVFMSSKHLLDTRFVKFVDDLLVRNEVAVHQRSC